MINEPLAARIADLIRRHPTFGYRQLWALLRFREGARMTPKTDRELIGHEFARRGRAKEAERALEETCLERFGTLRPAGATPTGRSDNGLIYQSRRFRAACRDYRLAQEFITPYTPDHRALLPQLQGGMRLAAQLRHLRARPARTERMDPLVQRGAPPSGAGLSEPARIPDA